MTHSPVSPALVASTPEAPPLILDAAPRDAIWGSVDGAVRGQNDAPIFLEADDDLTSRGIAKKDEAARTCKRPACDTPWDGDWTGLCGPHHEAYIDLYSEWTSGDSE